MLVQLQLKKLVFDMAHKKNTQYTYSKNSGMKKQKHAKYGCKNVNLKLQNFAVLIQSHSSHQHCF